MNPNKPARSSTRSIPCLPALCLAVALPAAAAQPPATPPPPSALDQIKKPADWFSWGADFRVRNEYFNNALSLSPVAADNEQDYFRYRARVWASVTPLDGLSLSTRLTTEPRTWMKPAGYSPYKGNSGTDWTYGLFDQLALQWQKPANLPITLNIGRQDLRFGDGWLVLEGTPNDGSWSIFLDSAKLTLDLKEAATTIDFVGIYQLADNDAWLPILSASEQRPLSDQDEKGFILNVANKSVTQANVDAYFIYKHDDLVTRYGDDADIYTVGARLAGALSPHWKYSVEGAYQLGQKDDLNVRYPNPGPGSRDIEAFGMKGRLSYLVGDRLQNQFQLNYEYLSGDDPATPEDEMFDILWGRWPQWSELYNVYSYALETRVSQTANLHRIGPGWSFVPTRGMDFSLHYNALFANESVPTRAVVPDRFSNDGNFRGHYFQAILKQKFSRHISGHLWSEFVLPGDFYVSDDTMTFLRAELMFSL